MPHLATKAAINCCLLALIASLAGCAAYAHKMPSTDADVQIIDRTNGEHLPLYWHDGRRYIAGMPGHRYAIEIGNRSGARVLAVVSVDGINAVTGATAAWDQNGYVFAPGQRRRRGRSAVDRLGCGTGTRARKDRHWPWPDRGFADCADRFCTRPRNT